MKTLMKNNGNGLNMLSKSLLAAVLILCGVAFFMASCDDDDNSPSPPPVETVVVMFGVEQGEGALVATLKENKELSKELKSPVELPKGKTIYFKATHSKSWKIKHWKVNGELIRSVEPEQTFTVNAHLDVRVAFEPYTDVSE